MSLMAIGPLAKQVECECRHALRVGDYDLGKRFITCTRKLTVCEGVQCRDWLSPQATADSRVLDRCPTDRFSDVKYRQIALRVTLNRHNRHNVFGLNDMIPFTHWSNLDFNSGEPAVEPDDNVRVPAVVHLHHGSTNLPQHVGEQSLGTIAEFDVSDFRPQLAQHRGNVGKVSRHTRASAQRLGPMM